jgi:hypothetical protein
MMRTFLIATAIGLLGVAGVPSFAGDVNTSVNTKGTSLTLDPSTKPSTGGGQGFQKAINPSTSGGQNFQATKSNAQNSGGQSPKTK